MEDEIALSIDENYQTEPNWVHGDDWYDEEARPLGLLFGAERIEEERIKLLWQNLNLNFGSNGKPQKKLGRIDIGEAEGNNLSKAA